MPSILIIDDESSLVRSLIYALEDDGHHAHGAASGKEGLQAALATHPDLILLDLRLPDMSGLDVLEALNEQQAGIPVIMISAHGDTRAAVKAVKLGAADYLTKPFELDDLFMTIRTTLERRQMASEIDFHRQEVVRHAGLVGASPVMRELADTIGKVAASGAARILILGESGTGKALVAKAIHAESARARGPFIEVNCASLPEQLIEAELFGAEKGAYTGAHQRRVGLVALADHGSLFLDEIGEVPLPLQAKLLHFLENGHYRAIGSGQAKIADVRVIAATNRDLTEDVARGRFREDLFYRLNVMQLTLPALRSRNEDILDLALHFAAQYAREGKAAPISFGHEARALLLHYRWPGNVRELKNLIERLTILFPGREIGPAELPREIADATARSPRTAAAPASSLNDALAIAERELVLSALRNSDGQKGRAASQLGISRHAFKRRLQRLGIA